MLGIPRIKEIINANKKIKTPIILAKLAEDVNNRDVFIARIVKGKLEKTSLGDICDSIEEVLGKDGCYIKISIDHETIKMLHLDLNMEMIKEAILGNTKAKVKRGNVNIENQNTILVSSMQDSKEKL